MAKKTHSLKNNLVYFNILNKAMPGHFFFSVVLVIITTLEALLIPLLYKIVLDSLFSKGSIQELIIIVAAYFVLETVAVLYEKWYYDVRSKQVEIAVEAYIRPGIFEKCLRIDYGKFDDPDFYNTYIKGVGDIGNSIIKTYHSIISLIQNILSALALGTLIVTMDFSLIFVAIAESIIVSFIMVKSGKLTYQLNTGKVEHTRRMSYVSSLFVDKQAIRDLKVTGMKRQLTKIFNDSVEGVRDLNKRMTPKIFKIGVLTDVTRNILFCVVVASVSISIYLGRISIGGFSAMINAFMNLEFKVRQLFSSVPNLISNGLYIDNYIKFMACDEHADARRTKTDACAVGIEIRDLWFKYNETDDFVLKGLDMSIPTNANVAIVGLNGAGKSTLVKLLAGLYSPTRGDILMNVAERSDAVNGDISVFFQDPVIYATTISGNVVMDEVDDGPATQQKVREALALAGLDETVAGLPQRERNSVTKQFDSEGVVFSKGQEQKLALSRVMYSDKRILILDEPTNHMDIQSETKFNRMMFETLRDKTVITISHRLASIINADIIYLISDGKVVQQGKHKDLIRQQGLYTALYSVEASEPEEDVAC